MADEPRWLSRDEVDALHFELIRTMSTRIPTHRAPAHPGEILERQFLQPLDMTQTELSERVEPLQT